MLLLRKNKKFITVIIALIIIVLLFSVVAIVALYTSPQQNYQQVDPAAVQALIEGTNADIAVQGDTFVVGEEDVAPVNEAGEAQLPDDAEGVPTEVVEAPTEQLGDTAPTDAVETN